ncbi:hypothetical protein MSG28_015080 [Choristoneura fumiferana]|uniref:Uncharacterized protein n=1 Tax=Choristoneura fumiferana TaxID=7141 RepID=A0ACC0KY49_CHOFU|nr:hypothetical protein MSG28_015080 [Choristoneura fumiferana]
MESERFSIRARVVRREGKCKFGTRPQTVSTSSGQVAKSFRQNPNYVYGPSDNEVPSNLNLGGYLLNKFFEHEDQKIDSDSYEVLHYCGKGFRLDVLECMEIIRYNSMGSIINEQEHANATRRLPQHAHYASPLCSRDTWTHGLRNSPKHVELNSV